MSHPLACRTTGGRRLHWAVGRPFACFPSSWRALSAGPFFRCRKAGCGFRKRVAVFEASARNIDHRGSPVHRVVRTRALMALVFRYSSRSRTCMPSFAARAKLPPRRTAYRVLVLPSKRIDRRCVWGAEAVSLNRGARNRRSGLCKRGRLHLRPSRARAGWNSALTSNLVSPTANARSTAGRRSRRARITSFIRRRLRVVVFRGRQCWLCPLTLRIATAKRPLPVSSCQPAGTCDPRWQELKSAE